MSREEGIERVKRALRRMPYRQREVYLAVRIDDADYRDIAKRLGITTKQVEREFAAAIRQVGRALRERHPEPWWRWPRWIGDHIRG
ncbi:RNA polymerase sigma factor [Pelagerythrobacter aerophilus]|nr:sigma-70 region 4 domain-containing protein [Pelagerythrobacter aerophilus]